MFYLEFFRILQLLCNVINIIGFVVYLTTLLQWLDYIDDKVISEWWLIGKALVGSGRDLILRYYPGIRLEGLRKPRKILIRDSEH
jgi:hypothetical protein